MNALERKLKRQIALDGPISVASYMAQCLSDPAHGYYTNRDPFGAQGDYITAPEISQMFGELIGIWFLDLWQQQGRPNPFHLVELGPGRGTLMADMVRAVLPHLQKNETLSIHLVEISPVLIQIQKEKLEPNGVSVTWHDDLSDLPQAPLFLIGNEFFDALPIHQWVAHKQKWHERVIGLDDDGALAFGLGPVRDMIAPGDNHIDDGAIFEHSPASEAIIAQIANHLTLHSGAGLFIDYGYDKPGFGDTFQALRQNAYANPLQHCGEQDLTAHVDFHALAKSAQETMENTGDNPAISRITTQSDFLLAMGLQERAGQLGAGKDLDVQVAIQTAVERLASPDQMGTLFKALALYPQAISAPVFSRLT